MGHALLGRTVGYARGASDHDPAAGWIRSTAPLKDTDDDAPAVVAPKMLSPTES